jgi:hypothetical protein
MQMMRIYGWIGMAVCLLGLGGCGGGPSEFPTAAFTIVTELHGDGTAVRVDATGCSDAQDGADALLVRWDWEGDDVYDTPYTPAKATEHVYPNPGRYTIVLDVKDSAGNCAQYRSGLEVSPRITLSPSQTMLSIGERAQFAATVTGIADHTITWMATGGAIADGHYTAPDAAGRYRITALSAVDPTVAVAATVTVVSGSLDVEVQ